ncbi:hypothetical protein K501DRAFT_149190, partial [Backusella circina FSU 941]
SKFSSSRLESDFVTVGKEMKAMVDVLVGVGVGTPTADGILVEGYKMTTYSMKLLSKGVYIMVKHNKTHLISGLHDISATPHITESLMQLTNLIN